MTSRLITICDLTYFNDSTYRLIKVIFKYLFKSMHLGRVVGSLRMDIPTRVPWGSLFNWKIFNCATGIHWWFGVGWNPVSSTKTWGPPRPPTSFYFLSFDPLPSRSYGIVFMLPFVRRSDDNQAYAPRLFSGFCGVSSPFTVNDARLDLKT